MAAGRGGLSGLSRPCLSSLNKVIRPLSGYQVGLVAMFSDQDRGGAVYVEVGGHWRRCPLSKLDPGLDPTCR